MIGSVPLVPGPGYMICCISMVVSVRSEVRLQSDWSGFHPDSTTSYLGDLGQVP